MFHLVAGRCCVVGKIRSAHYINTCLVSVTLASCLSIPFGEGERISSMREHPVCAKLSFNVGRRSSSKEAFLDIFLFYIFLATFSLVNIITGALADTLI